MKKLLSLILIVLLFISCASLKNQNVDNTKQNISSISTTDTNKESKDKKDEKNSDVVEIKNSSKENQDAENEIQTSINVEKKEIIIRLIISKEGSKEIIFDRRIKTLPGKNALQILKDNANVYEVGGFIKKINGIASIPQNELSNEDIEKGILGYDWFIYLNGKKTKVGARDIFPKDGDTLNFDYKGWTIKDLAP